MPAELICFNKGYRSRYPVTEILYNCPRCNSLLEVDYPEQDLDPEALKRTFRERRMDNSPLNQSGVWCYRELFGFLDDCAAFGLEGAEPTSYYFPGDVTLDYLRRLKAHAFRLGLDISGTAVGNDLCHPPGEQRDA